VGEKQNQPFQLSFNAALKIACQGSRVTSDGGLILVPELDERLALGPCQVISSVNRTATRWVTKEVTERGVSLRTESGLVALQRRA
jgi:hypothetical protein